MGGGGVKGKAPRRSTSRRTDPETLEGSVRRDGAGRSGLLMRECFLFPLFFVVTKKRGIRKRGACTLGDHENTSKKRPRSLRGLRSFALSRTVAVIPGFPGQPFEFRPRFVSRPSDSGEGRGERTRDPDQAYRRRNGNTCRTFRALRTSRRDRGSRRPY